MLISVCVVARNEEKTIQGILSDIQRQTYPHDKMEIILIDSMSDDRTKQMMLQFKESYSEFYDIQVLDNPKKKQAPGWNVALRHYKGDAILRLDAHASVPEDFVMKNVKVLESGEYVSGGKRPNIIADPTPWRETLLLAEQSMFGSSVANYRRSEKRGYVKSLFHGAYRREVFERAGGFNESLGRTEDNEMHYRIRKAGFHLCYSPDIVSFQHTRGSLKGMMKQKFGNGFWVSLTLKVCPRCLSYYHFVPLIFVLAILGTAVLVLVGVWQPAVLMWGCYWATAVIMALLSVRGQSKTVYNWLLPGLFFLLHISYGIGSLIGLIKLPFWKEKTGV